MEPPIRVLLQSKPSANRLLLRRCRWHSPTTGTSVHRTQQLNPSSAPGVDRCVHDAGVLCSCVTRQALPQHQNVCLQSHGGCHGQTLAGCVHRRMYHPAVLTPLQHKVHQNQSQDGCSMGGSSGAVQFVLICTRELPCSSMDIAPDIAPFSVATG